MWGQALAGRLMRVGLGLSLLWGGGVTGSVWAGPPPHQAPGVPQQPQIINLNLLNALVAIKAQDMAGVFGFIPENAAAPALADYLLHNHSAFKRFLNKCEADLKDVGGVNEWDQQVFLYMTTLLSSGVLAADVQKPPEKWIHRISVLSLAPAMPLSEITLRKKQ